MSKFIPNSFQLPNAIVDDMLCKLSGNACKIYLLIVRKTRGWHKEADKISYSQIQKYTGINHRATISKALDDLLELGLIFVQKGNEKSMSEYRLNDDFCCSKNELDKKCTSSKNEPASSKNELEAGSKNEHTEIQYKKNTNTKYNNIYTHDESKTLNVPFDVFWDAYDKKIGTKKCETLWKRLSDKDRLDIMAYIPKYILSQPDKQFRKHPQTFLNNRAWEDEIIDNQKRQQPTRSQPNKPNRMAEFAEQSTQWGDDFYNKQTTIGAIE